MSSGDPFQATIRASYRADGPAEVAPGPIAAYPRAHVAPETASLHGLVLPCPCQVRDLRTGTTLTVWIYAVEGGVPGEMRVSKRVADHFGHQERPAEWDLALTAPPKVALASRAPRVTDLPRSDEVLVPIGTAAALGIEGRRRRRWALLVGRDVTMPVRIVERDREAGTIGLPLRTRLLIGIDNHETVHLLAVPGLQGAGGAGAAHRERLVPLWLPPKAHPALRRVIAVGWGVLRTLDGLVERVLAVALGAPAMSGEVVQAELGDDARSARLEERDLELIQVEPSDHVLVRWGPRQAVASVYSATGSLPLPTEVRQAADLPVLPAPRLGPVPRVRLSASVRADLGIPANTVVTVRRRIRTMLLRRAHALSLPAVGLALAALAIPGTPVSAVAVGVGIVVVLELMSLRARRPPRGTWP